MRGVAVRWPGERIYCRYAVSRPRVCRTKVSCKAATRGRANSRYLPQQILLIRRLVKPHEQLLAPADRRGAKIPTGTQQQLRQPCIARFGLFQAKIGDFLALGDPQFIDGACELEGRRLGDPLLSGVDLLDNRRVSLRKEPLRSLATRSATSVVVPVNACWHGKPPVGWWKAESGELRAEGGELLAVVTFPFRVPSTEYRVPHPQPSALSPQPSALRQFATRDCRPYTGPLPRMQSATQYADSLSCKDTEP